MTTPSPVDSGTELRDIQGGLIGFNKDHQRLLPFDFPDAPTAIAVLTDLLPLLTSGWEVLRFNELYSEIRSRGNPSGLNIVQAEWANLWLSAPGLQLLSPADAAGFPDDFRQGMAARKATLGDAGPSDPANWTGISANGAVPHAIVVIAADTEPGRDEAAQRVLNILSSHSITPAGPPQDGDVRPGAEKGFEHFGFKDGISQPGIDGFTTPSKAGSGSVAPGEFLIGYPDQDGNTAGQPPVTPNPPTSPGYPVPTPPAPTGLPTWARNGSFVVYRRLRQDVAAFRQFVGGSSQWGLTPDQLGAKLVGRWKSGAPMEPDGLPAGLPDPSLTDPSTSSPTVLNDDVSNNFTFDNDADGAHVPRAAHIRKVNPRSEQLPGPDKTSRHRMLRRGIPYGPEFVDTEPAYGPSVPDSQDRGLLFVCYQASIARTFETVQGAWANKPDFPTVGDGEDPIISQDTTNRPFHLPSPQDAHLQIAQWVTTTGGGYFFSPSISAVAHLAGVTPITSPTNED
jgi:Dyp-type peroxidase family